MEGSAVLTVRLSSSRSAGAVVALPVADAGLLRPVPVALPDPLPAEIDAYLESVEHTGSAGSVQTLVRPLGRPGRVLLVGVGAGDEAGWRAAGAAVTRAALREKSVTVALAKGADPELLRGLVEGLLLAAYRYRLGAEKQPATRVLRQVTVAV